MSPQDLLVRRIGRLTTWAAPVVTDAALLVRNGRVFWSGAESQLPAGLGDVAELDAAGAAVIPGFVDAHTHAVFAGDRRAELTARITGTAYAAGGIATTVAATCAASDGELRGVTAARLAAMRSGGTTTAEIKTGYARSIDGEFRLLRIAAEAAGAARVRAELTWLAAHVVPEGRDAAGYVAEVVASLSAARAAGARWCDVFCDVGAFSPAQTEQILAAAVAAGLEIRMHADQLERTGAASLAARLGCTSADHLDRVDSAGATALAAAGVVGVLMPVASMQTRGGGDHFRTLRAAGVTLALATDCNPGTAWCESMALTIQLACWLWGMSVEDALCAATLGGAESLRRHDIGHLGAGAWADFAVLNSDHEAELATHLGADAVTTTAVGGVV